jgi:two-component system, cell cycle response regulator CpdR
MFDWPATALFLLLEWICATARHTVIEPPSKILVAEDDDCLRFLIATCLQGSGYVVVAAQNGSEAAKLIVETSFDLVLTDLQMPEMDGIALIAWMREVGITTPVIAMTGGSADTSASELLNRAAALGVCAGLAKPFTIAELNKAVAGALGRRYSA